MPDKPLINITMPVFNRLQSTQRVLLALRRTERAVPFAITVVDNGSDRDLVDRLVEFKKAGLIDKLFLLPENMGISCAANIGWRLTEAPVYMKLDNDMVARRPDWPAALMRIWAHGKPLSTFGGAQNEQQLLAEPDAIETPDGTLGICTGTLAGQAMFVPKQVSDILGYWSEDYGLYGAEDGDYGQRMRIAGLPQYYYHGDKFFEDTGGSDIHEVYTTRKVDRAEMYARLFKDGQGGTGLFLLNNYLFNMCIRSWNVPLRYEILDISEDGRVKVAERADYAPIRETLLKSKALVDDKLISSRAEVLYHPEFMAELRAMWAACGQSCDNILGGIE